MFKQSVSIIEFSELYNILYEVKHLFGFNLYNYKNFNDFISKIESNAVNNSIVILKQKDRTLLQNSKIVESTILVLDKLPVKLEKIIDLINTNLIKNKYEFQSKLHINQYVINLNSRIISNNINKLRLTEKEINIILFLNKENKEQTITSLQKIVWGYSSGLDTHTVETHIYRLRKKIKDNFNDENFIINFKNGYKIQN
jgi:DNA-binding response OmpR family regulator